MRLRSGLPFDARSVLLELRGLYRISLVRPQGPTDPVLGLVLVVLFPAMVALSIASNWRSRPTRAR